ncbi:Uncharacterised protein [Mycobacteroides abscessus subsp. abscessus]|nr:Uncharacterised protein [Mycobacteroides abscessus subsp. abscessus]
MVRSSMTCTTLPAGSPLGDTSTRPDASDVARKIIGVAASHSMCADSSCDMALFAMISAGCPTISRNCACVVICIPSMMPRRLDAQSTRYAVTRLRRSAVPDPVESRRPCAAPEWCHRALRRCPARSRGPDLRQSSRSHRGQTCARCPRGCCQRFSSATIGRRISSSRNTRSCLRSL